MTQLTDKVGMNSVDEGKHMKKILLASTALVLSAGLAQAQGLSISGQGRMGIQYNSTGIAGGSNYQAESRLQLNFNVSVQGDNGLTFGAYSRARMQTGAPTGLGGFNVAQPGMFSGSRVWVEASGLRLTIGNTDGALRGPGTAFGYAGGCGVGYEGGQLCADSMGLLGVSQRFNSTGAPTAQRIRVDYTMGDTRVAVSNDRSGATEVGIRTSFDAWTVALGYTNGNGNAASGGWAANQAVTTVSAGYNGGSWSAGVGVAGGGGNTNYVLQGSANMGGGSLYGFVGRVASSATYGLSYGYGLGGGATLVAGAERNTAGAGVTTASLGVVFNF